jgi:peptidyl-prolyl cis-trans isomerase SurA
MFSGVQYTERVRGYGKALVNAMPRKRITNWFSLLCLGMLCARSALPSGAEVVEEIIAQVNDHVIVLSEYRRALDTLKQDLGQEASGLDLEGRFQERSKDALRDLIDQQLLAQKATELGIGVETDIVKRLDEIRQQMNLPTMEALEEAAQRQGMVFEDFKQNMRDNLLTQAVISREVGSRVKIAPEEIKAYYDEHQKEFARPEGVHIQQILISTEGKDEAELPALRQKAEEVLAKARGGQNFAELARQYSDDATASKGGDAGFFERGTMAPDIETAAYALKNNDVSNILSTQYGLMIIKLLERSSGGIPPLAEVEPRIQERIYFQKIQPALREDLTQLRQQSYISLKPGYTDTGEAPKQTAQKP